MATWPASPSASRRAGEGFALSVAATLALGPDLTGAFALAMARVGALAAAMPGFGDRVVPRRVRLGLALILALPLVPGLAPAARAAALAPAGLPGALLAEALIGAALGFAARAVIAAFEAAGEFAASAIGLSYAATVDPGGAAPQPSLGVLLRVLAVALVFAADLHHLAIGAVRASYEALPPGALPGAADLARFAVERAAACLAVALKLAAPLLAGGLLVNLGAALVGRAAPRLQVLPLVLAGGSLAGLLLLALAMPHTVGLARGALAEGLSAVAGR